MQVKNYYQRRLDSGQKDFEEILLVAEDQKARGEPTGPLPVPSVAPKRRYEATPSAIVPRPLAPHGDPTAEAEEARLSSKSKAIAMSPQPMALQNRHLPDNERSSNRYAPLAQASIAASVPPVAATLGDEGSRVMRAQPGPANHRLQGPRLGYFTDDRRDSVILSHSTPRAQEMPIPPRHTPAAPMPSDMTRMDPLPSQAYMSPPALLPQSHSRRPSLPQAPKSPPQLSRPQLDLSSVHRDPFAQRQYYSPSGQPLGLPQPSRPVLSPVKDSSRPRGTAALETTPRQVPAKRSNIMSILNDEPEEPQPRKRFASEQTTSAPVPSSAPASRAAYPPAGSVRSDDAAGAQKSSSYGTQSHYPTSSRVHSEFSSYGAPSGSGTSVNNDWMARFDPRAQQTAPQSQTQAPPPPQSGRPTTSVNSQSPFSHYSPTPSQPAGPLNNLPVPSPAPTPPPASQRASYANVFTQPNSGQGPVSAARDLPPQLPAYRPGSPPSRSGGVAFGSRQEPPTPVQSSATLFGIPPRPGAHPSYALGTPSTPLPSQPHNQSYQQHVQTLVNGSHQSHRPTPVSLSSGPPQYGHSTPPPQAQAGRSMPPLATLGRSYTPPLALHPTVSGPGLGYAPPPPTTGTIAPLHQRPPGLGSLGEPTSASGHHRVYSQGSASGGLPGPLHPSSQPPR